MNAVVIVGAALGFALGIIMLISAWVSPPRPRRRRARSVDREQLLVRAATAVFSAVTLLLITGWLVAFAVGGLAGWQLMGAWLRRRAGAGEEQDRIEALAAWCQQLRDLLSADHGPLGTVVASVETCPVAIRPEVRRLATRIERQDPPAALQQFAAELDDPSGDLVASVLLMAMSHSGRTAELLSELAITIQERATMRLRVEADRSGQRSEGRFVIGFAVVIMSAIVLFGRNSTFLDAYDSPAGQLALIVVAVMFAFGVAWLNRLTRFEQPARFLSIGRRP